MIAAIEGRGPSGPVGLLFWIGVSVGFERDLRHRALGGESHQRQGGETGDQQGAEGPHRGGFSQQGHGFPAAAAAASLRGGGERGREPEMGFEPMTYHLRGGCSATELLRRMRPLYQRAVGPPWWWHDRERAGSSHSPPVLALQAMMLAVSATIEGPVRRVMVGTDRSETASSAVRWAAGFADRFEADLYVVQIVAPRASRGHGVRRRRGTRAGAAAADLQHYARSSRASAGTRRSWCDDDPAMAIVQATEDEAIDVLVVGNAGMAGRKEFLLGNVPNRSATTRDAP